MKTKVSLACKYKVEEVLAEVYKEYFGIHYTRACDSSYGYTITHIPTGMSIIDWVKNIDTAKKVVDGLLKITTNWSFNYLLIDRRSSHTTEEIHKIRKLLNFVRWENEQ